MVDTCIRSCVGGKKMEVKGMDSCDRNSLRWRSVRGRRVRGYPTERDMSEANSTAAHKQQQTHSDRLRVKRGQGKPVFVLDRIKVGFVQIELCQSRDV